MHMEANLFLHIKLNKYKKIEVLSRGVEKQASGCRPALKNWSKYTTDINQQMGALHLFAGHNPQQESGGALFFWCPRQAWANLEKFYANPENTDNYLCKICAYI